MYFLILAVCILGVVAASQAVQIVQLSKKLVSQYTVANKKNKN